MPSQINGKSRYDVNLQYIRSHSPQLFQLLQAAAPSRTKTEKAKNGSATLVYIHENTHYYLHSRFNPEAESLKLVEKKDSQADHFVILGLGLGYHLQKLLTLKDPLARVFLVEPDIEIFQRSMETLDWIKLMKRSDFFYVLGPDPAGISNVIHQFLNIASLDKLEFLELPSETRLLHDFFTKAKEIIQAEVKSNLYDFKTRLAESYMMPRNILKNLPWLLQTKPVASLTGAFKGKPGILVSAGPSLDRNILYLKKINHRAMIISVDTALKPLLSRSIQPHFTASGDPSHKNYLHLQGTQNVLNYFIAAEAGISNQVFRDFKNKIFALSVGKPIIRMMENHSQPLGEVKAWGSVISIALELAVIMGLNPIILVGQDFAFTGRRNHCRGTSWEEKQIEYSHRLDELQRFESQAISGNRKVLETKDIYGQPTYTSERMTLYKNYLAQLIKQYPQTEFINASEGGIFSGIPDMTLHDALQKYVFGSPPIDISALHQFPTLGSKGHKDKIIAFLEEKHGFFKDYKETLKQALNMLEKSNDAEGERLEAMFRHAEAVQTLPYPPPGENGEFLEMWSAAPIYNFMKAYRHIRNNEFNTETLKEGCRIYQTYFKGISPLVTDIVQQLEKTIDALTGTA